LGVVFKKNELLMGDDKGDEGGGDNSWVSLFLKNLPRNVFGPLVGVELLLVRGIMALL
jgi:hypothetical protein